MAPYPAWLEAVRRLLVAERPDVAFANLDPNWLRERFDAGDEPAAVAASSAMRFAAPGAGAGAGVAEKAGRGPGSPWIPFLLSVIIGNLAGIFGRDAAPYITFVAGGLSILSFALAALAVSIGPSTEHRVSGGALVLLQIALFYWVANNNFAMGLPR